MAASSLTRSLKKRLRRIRRFAATAAGAGRKAELHALRIELKRWRAHLRLLRAADPAFPYPEVYAPFKKLFAQAGLLRFWQLQGDYLRRWPGAAPAFTRAYRAYLNRRRGEARASLRAAAWAHLPHWRDLKREIRQSAARCTPETVLDYFDTLRQSINRLQHHPTRRHPTQLHELRKTLKEYANNRPLAARHLGIEPGAPAATPPDFDRLLGQWHDADAACAQLAADLREQGWTPEELVGGRKVLKQWRMEKIRLWRDVVRAIETGR